MMGWLLCSVTNMIFEKDTHSQAGCLAHHGLPVNQEIIHQRHRRHHRTIQENLRWTVVTKGMLHFNISVIHVPNVRHFQIYLPSERHPSNRKASWRILFTVLSLQIDASFFGSFSEAKEMQYAASMQQMQQHHWFNMSQALTKVPSASSLQNEHGVEPFASRDLLMAARLEVHKISRFDLWAAKCLQNPYSGCAWYGKHVEPVRTG